MFPVLPVAITVVDWNTYLANAKAMLGRSISTTVDRQHGKLDLPAFIATLKDLQTGKPTDIPTALREGGSLLRHASASFLCLLPSEIFYELLVESGLAVTVQDSPMGAKLCLVSGNLEQWRTAVINCSVPTLSIGLRGLMNRYMAYFEQSGLGPIWSDFSKTPMPDATFRLTEK
jgi:hypothetical protein